VVAEVKVTALHRDTTMSGHLRYEVCLNVWGALLQEWRKAVSKVQVRRPDRLLNMHV
jgi:hypothetical protein